jgi:hypothetical protein
LKNGLFVRLIFIIDHFSSPSEVDYNIVHAVMQAS